LLGAHGLEDYRQVVVGSPHWWSRCPRWFVKHSLISIPAPSPSLLTGFCGCRVRSGRTLGGFLFLCIIQVAIFAIGAGLGVSIAALVLTTPLGTVVLTQPWAHILIVCGAGTTSLSLTWKTSNVSSFINESIY
jgi:hypothetical protein